MEKQEVLTIDYFNMPQFLKNTAPYVFVDYAKVIPGKSAKGYKLFTRNEWFFDCHFPGNPIVPGIFLLETVVQTATLALYALSDPFIDFVYSNKVFSAEFPNAVRPGDKLETEIKIEKNRRGIVQSSGEGFIRRNEKKLTACKADFQLLIPGLLKSFSPIKEK